MQYDQLEALQEARAKLQRAINRGARRSHSNVLATNVAAKSEAKQNAEKVTVPKAVLKSNIKTTTLGISTPLSFAERILEVERKDFRDQHDDNSTQKVKEEFGDPHGDDSIRKVRLHVL